MKKNKKNEWTPAEDSLIFCVLENGLIFSNFLFETLYSEYSEDYNYFTKGSDNNDSFRFRVN